MRTRIRLTLVGLLAVLPMVTLAAETATRSRPEVTVRQEGDNTIKEYRVKGFLYAVQVVPKHGKPYYLVRPDGSDANVVRSDQPDMLIPQWEILKW